MGLFDLSDYTSHGGLIERSSISEVAPHLKEILLKETLAHFCGSGELPKLDEFVFLSDISEIGDDLPEWGNCCCSQRILKGKYIQHKKSSVTFKIGSNCFEKLYGKLEVDEINFFKPLCKNCKKTKVLSRKSKAGKAGFCEDKCMNYYNKKACCVECGEKFWKLMSHHYRCRKCFINSFHHDRSNK